MAPVTAEAKKARPQTISYQRHVQNCEVLAEASEAIMRLRQSGVTEKAMQDQVGLLPGAKGQGMDSAVMILDYLVIMKLAYTYPAFDDWRKDDIPAQFAAMYSRECLADVSKVTGSWINGDGLNTDALAYRPDMVIGDQVPDDWVPPYADRDMVIVDHSLDGKAPAAGNDDIDETKGYEEEGYEESEDEANIAKAGHCDALSAMAEGLMRKRQGGVPMREVMADLAKSDMADVNTPLIAADATADEKAKSRDSLRATAMEQMRAAYKVAMGATQAEKDQAATEFGSQILLDCLE